MNQSIIRLWQGILFLSFMILSACQKNKYQDKVFHASVNEEITAVSEKAVQKNALKDFKAYYVQEEEVVNFIEMTEGKVVLIDFWFSYCAPCLEAMPQLQQFYEKYKEDGFVIIGVNPVDGIEKLERIEKKLSELNISYPSLIAHEKVADNYVIGTYPTLMLFDREGNLVKSHVGFTTEESMKELELKIQTINGKR